jgi:hypothetical protein
MGFMTLLDFKNEISSVLGGRTVDATRAKNWVNMAYFDTCGAVDFPELGTTPQFNSVAATAQYSIVDGVYQVLAVYDTVAKLFLRRVRIEEYARQDHSEAGPPKLWSRHGASIFLNPVPTDIRAIKYYARSEPAPLAVDGDKTILPRTWDQAISMFSIATALFSLNEDSRATTWYNRAIAYTQTRMLEGETPTPQGGV